MSLFFLLVEPLIYIAGGYLLFYKKDLAICYLPTLFFSSSVIVSSLPAIVEYAFFSFYIGILIYFNPKFYKKNIFAILLFILHIALIPYSSDLVLIRPTLFSVMWMLLLVPLTMTILEKHSRKEIFKELSNAVFIILVVFILNVLFSTFFNYSPYDMYGIESGILYGELINTDFNILAIATFIAFLLLTYRMNPWYLFLTLLSLSMIGLSMRRSVIGVCLLGIIFILLILFMRGQSKQVFGISSLIFLAVVFVAIFTDFSAVFKDRFEQRNLGERELAGEARFAEYAILYKDAFVHHDFNPWTGYELLNSGGNYGKGIFGNRSLHGDITNIIHSTGILGLLLYLTMVGKCFRDAIRNIRLTTDILIILFCISTFIVFTITGRYVQVDYMILLFLTLFLPLGKASSNIPKREKTSISTKI